MIYGYARVSTPGQARDGHSLESQEKNLRENWAEEIFADNFTGKKLCRPQLDALLDRLSDGDTLIVTKLDRIARSAIDGMRLVDELMERGVTINILNLGVLSNSTTGRLIRNIFFAFAEFERDLIIDRTQAGKAVARTKAGFKDGRPKKFTQEQLRHAVGLLESHTYKEVEAMMKMSKSTLQRAKKAASAETIKGRANEA
ncbi:MAG: recombinase family protein [Leptospirales bacterium]|nr:recombinase family protein [Leptospirales bacterium]